MPSPFPGMDPFLEHPEVFPGLHNGLIYCMQEHLQQLLPPAYYARNQSRNYLDIVDHDVIPDVEVGRYRGKRRSTFRDKSLAARRTEPVVIQVPRVEYREWFLDVHHVEAGKHRLVTSIEVVSPSNKR